MRELKDLMFGWLDRIEPEARIWHPDPQAVQIDHRQQDLVRELAALDVYVDAHQWTGDDGRTDRRAV